MSRNWFWIGNAQGKIMLHAKPPLLAPRTREKWGTRPSVIVL